MSLASLSGGDVADPTTPVNASTVDSMIVNGSTSTKLVAHEHDDFLPVDFVEDVAATYHLLAQRLRLAGLE